MNLQLQEFVNDEFGRIRVIDEKGHVVVNGADAARALGYARPSEAVRRHCRHAEKRFAAHPQSPDKQMEMLFIPEGDLYRLVVSSKLPAARRFEAWIYDEVLPAVRMSGAEKLHEDRLADALVSQTQNLVKLQEALAAQNDLARFARGIQMSETNISMKKLTTLVQNIRLENGRKINTGQKRLMSWMRRNGYLCYSKRENNIPTQRAMDLGLFEVRESIFEPEPGVVFLDHTTCVTPKGQAYFIRLFMEKGLEAIR
ncbi:phage antirepressor KilAC domain-containing protein [Eubacterium sp. 1001713B170207_170306_E7]|uniref:phage antirepressor KilAC domain-containing protein n=1 Tax=Eubacterium sp. 1001713B170207_170306_E7 TaxID=2787097 RepID=UPI00189B62FD|nr:phage antirepressor KilAC domain-containing protein [Eubacterium sp. 1001713B170207_170306_E7]